MLGSIAREDACFARPPKVLGADWYTSSCTHVLTLSPVTPVSRRLHSVGLLVVARGLVRLSAAQRFAHRRVQLVQPSGVGRCAARLLCAPTDSA